MFFRIFFFIFVFIIIFFFLYGIANGCIDYVDKMCAAVDYNFSEKRPFSKIFSMKHSTLI